MKKVTLISIALLMVLFLSGTGAFASDPGTPTSDDSATSSGKGGGENPAPETKGTDKSDKGEGDHPSPHPTKPE